MTDDRLTAQIRRWLDTPAGDRDMDEAARLVLKLTRNRIFAANIARRGKAMMAKAEYELGKHLTMRLDRKTAADVRRMERELMPAAAGTLAQPPATGAGKRADHDSLPDDIRALWDENTALWHDIRLLFEELKGMDSATACDRYELLKILDAKERRHRANFERYDGYRAGEEEA